MLRIISKLLTVMLLSVVVSSCSSLNCTNLESYFGGPADLVKLSYGIADSLSLRAMPPLLPHSPDSPILLTTFVDNNNLDSTNGFGRLLQEHMGSRFVQHGYAVKEIKLQNNLNIEEQAGETMLSRNLDKIDNSQQAQAILVGTYSRTARRLYISARLVNPVDKTIIASNDYRLCMDREMLELFGLTQANSSDNAVEEPPQPFLNRIF